MDPVFRKTLFLWKSGSITGSKFPKNSENMAFSNNWVHIWVLNFYKLEFGSKLGLKWKKMWYLQFWTQFWTPFVTSVVLFKLQILYIYIFTFLFFIVFSVVPYVCIGLSLWTNSTTQMAMHLIRSIYKINERYYCWLRRPAVATKKIKIAKRNVVYTSTVRKRVHTRCWEIKLYTSTFI